MPPRGAASDAAHKHVLSLLHKIDATPAKTVDGIKVKAKAIAWIYSDGMDDFLGGETTDQRLVRQIIAGLLTA